MQIFLSVARFTGSDIFASVILGFRSQSLAPPQARCSRLLRRLIQLTRLLRRLIQLTRLLRRLIQFTRLLRRLIQFTRLLRRLFPIPRSAR